MLSAGAESHVSAFGERLRREREMRGVSLDDIARSTKIGTRFLRALEEEHFEILPGGIFNKSYVRSYAHYLGIDEEEAVADYMVACSQKRQEADVVEQMASAQPLRNGTAPAPSYLRAAFPIIPVLILIVVATAAAGGWQMYREHQRSAPRAAVNPTAPVTAKAAPVATANRTTDSSNLSASRVPAAGTSNANDAPATVEPVRSSRAARPQPERSVVKPAPPDNLRDSMLVPQAQAATAEAGNTLLASAAETNASPFEVMVRAKDRAWVSIKSDGKLMVRGVIKPPETKTIYANDQVVFWTGNAGDVEVSFNGKSIPLTGGQNDQRVLVFNARGLLPAQAVP